MSGAFCAPFSLFQRITDTRDSIGNTTAAVGKSFAIGSAALIALALLAADTTIRLDSVRLTNPLLIVGLFIGGMLPFLFSAMTTVVGVREERRVAPAFILHPHYQVYSGKS